jgi:hypothetical protein
MKHRLLAVCIGVALLWAVSAVALAQTGGGYDLMWSTVDGGGTTFGSGGGYSLSATAGQADAGVLTGGGYTLAGGFWRGGAVVDGGYKVYMPVVVRNYP